MRTLAQRQTGTRPAWRDVASTFVVCTDDYAMNPAYQRERATSATFTTELDADHSPFYSATDAVVTLLDARARALNAG
ncbi:hypothetical protein CH296_26660 [Rhodococcus sp. 14-2496-1d]|nr:hypothetical protein CH296_26660 [Rhodococcus sp. 14-2496-1d]